MILNMIILTVWAAILILSITIDLGIDRLTRSDPLIDVERWLDIACLLIVVFGHMIWSVASLLPRTVQGKVFHWHFFAPYTISTRRVIHVVA